MSNNLMREMLCFKPRTTIEMFTLKKHIQHIPNMKNKSITSLSKEDYALLSKS